MNIQQLQTFKKEGPNKYGTTLNVSNEVKTTLAKIKSLLEKNGGISDDLMYDMKSILTRAHMIDLVFNPIHHEETAGEWKLDLDFTPGGFGYIDDADEKKENIVYCHTPIIGVFYQGTPIFLNSNYVEALGAETEETLKNDIKTGTALEKYYIPECVDHAKQAISMLSNGQGYKNLILITKNGKKISWNSFGNTDGLEIRIGNDITQGTFKTTQTFNQDFEGLDLNTSSLVKGFLLKVNKIIGTDHEITNNLILFGVLGAIIDKIWNSGQFLMNVTIGDEDESTMLFNTRYSDALKRTKDEIIRKLEEKDESVSGEKIPVLWRETYDDDTLRLINGLLSILQDEGYYISEFALQDAEGKSSIYSWLRLLIKDSDFGLDRTFGIGTSAISKENAELRDFLEKNK